MNENILSWNVTNWITVVLMAAVGFAVLGLVTKSVRNYQQTGSIGLKAAA